MNEQDVKLIEHYCLSDDLSTYDPYDVWTGSIGFSAKRFYNRHHILALPIVGTLTLFDRICAKQLLYKKREYPIVRALSTLALLNLYELNQDQKYLDQAKRNLEWELSRTGKCEFGMGWGSLVPRTVTKTVEYPSTMCYTTITPYPLEAFARYREVAGSSEYDWVFPKIRDFFQKDVKQMLSTETEAAYSYGTVVDRIEYNSNCYSLYSRALLGSILQDRSDDEQIVKIYQFVKNNQREDGSWYYSYSSSHSFIDCFHSCFNMKNIFKASKLVDLPGVESVLERGWNYLKSDLFDPEVGLFRRFSIANKPGVIKYDLYDNAEALNLAVLLGDIEFAARLNKTVQERFVGKDCVYSRIDLCNKPFCPDYLRWAVAPYLYSLSVLLRVQP